MSLKLMQDVILNINGSIRILKEGTVISEISDLGDIGENTKNKLLLTIQDWMNNFKSRFSDDGWNKIMNLLQPIINAIYAGDLQPIEQAIVDINNKSKQMAKINPKAKDSLNQIHNLYNELLNIIKNK